MTRLKFLGAARQVTGSSCLLETGRARLLVDCGLHQERSYLERNWRPFPAAPDRLDAVLLTHVHLDHSGLLPKLVRDGFAGPILMTEATADLLPIALLDAAHIQEEDAAFKAKRHRKEGRSGPHPELPLYTTEDARRVLPLVRTVPYGKLAALDGGVTAVFHDAGHILGSSMIEVGVSANGASRTLVFSGDIGQWNKPLVRDPSTFAKADAVVMESTYGDRDHEEPANAPELLARIVRETVARGGNVVIPTFAIERAQEMMFHFSRLVRAGRVPAVPVFLDSPMAVEVTEVFERHPEILDEETRARLDAGEPPFRFPGLSFVRTSDESKAINDVRGPCVIMAGSGMCTGGRIKHHLVRNISRPESTVLFVGFQARETLGRHIADGAAEVRILGETYPVRARIAQILGFSAHADRGGLRRWLAAFRKPPRALFVCHGEREVAAGFAGEIGRRQGWTAKAPDYLENAPLP